MSFVVESPEPMLWGGELLLRDGAPAGQVTSAAWGETVGACVGLAYLRSDGPVTADSLRRRGFEVDVAGERYAVRGFASRHHWPDADPRVRRRTCAAWWATTRSGCPASPR